MESIRNQIKERIDESYKKKIEELTRTIKERQNDYTGYLNLGILQLQHRKFQDALLDLNKAYDLDPNVSLTLQNRAEVLLALDNLTDSLNDVLRAIALDLENTQAYPLLGRILSQFDDHAKLITDFNNRIAQDQKNVTNYYSLGFLYEMTENYERALKNYETAV